jgi:uncharacterized protein
MPAARGNRPAQAPGRGDSVHRHLRPALQQPHRVPKPTTQAVMFCLMDVSGSMDEVRSKDTAKRFFMLLYLFLSALRAHRGGLHPPPHHGQGGRRGRVLPLPRNRRHGGVERAEADARHHRRPLRRWHWNIYAAQASDGDNWDNDSPICRNCSPRRCCRWCSTTPTSRSRRANRSLWREYERLADTTRSFAMQRIEEPEDIYPVFRELFKKTHEPPA